MKRRTFREVLRMTAGAVACVCVATTVLTACQKEPAVWQEQESVDVEAISKDVFSEETSSFDDSTVSETDTEVFVVEDTTPEIPEIHVKTPAFSHEGGIYSNDLAVTLNCSEPYNIHYTTYIC